ncbi:MAG TPA: hypothetical protein VE078_01480 [Thermoanaerobaculia bacterium]|nr:hypothetical protein [Thermoanaerobaculia bacterium]
MCQNPAFWPRVKAGEPLKHKQQKEMRFTLLVHTKTGNAALGAGHGILEVRRLVLGVVHGPLEVGHGILEVEHEPLGVRHATPEADNPRLDPVRQRPGVEHPKPKAGNQPPEPKNAAHEVEDGKLEVDDEPLELANQRLEVEKKRVDSARQLRRVGGGALDQGDGAGLGQDSGLGRVGRRT